MKIRTILKGIGGALAALVIAGTCASMAGYSAPPDAPTQGKRFRDLTQAERKERYEANKLAAVRENNLSRDPADRARVMCAFAKGLDANLDWPVVERKGVWYVGNLCKLRRNAEADLEVF